MVYARESAEGAGEENEGPNCGEQRMDMPTEMMAAVLYGLNDVRLDERPVPTPGHDEVLVRIEACSLCAGDIRIITKGMPNQPPFGEFIIGHEYAGTIVERGDSVDEFAIGDRVAVEVHKGCGRCRNCRVGKYTVCLNYGNTAKGHRANGFTTNGGFAEFAVNHVATISKLPDSISMAEGTVITTAGTALFAIDMAGGNIAGDTVVVTGPGSIGLMCVQCAKALGAGKVILTGTEDDLSRLALGSELGADEMVNVSVDDPVARIREGTGDLGSDLVLVANGQDNALQEALEMTRKGGNIVVLAHFDGPVPADIGIAVRNGINIFTVRGEGRMSVHRALSLMAEGKIDGRSIITHSFPLTEIHDAIATFVERRGDAIKVMVRP
jgi:L-iditol 2-dehydrogenase